jgi:hypothetical protein
MSDHEVKAEFLGCPKQPYRYIHGGSVGVYKAYFKVEVDGTSLYFSKNVGGATINTLAGAGGTKHLYVKLDASGEIADRGIVEVNKVPSNIKKRW